MTLNGESKCLKYRIKDLKEYKSFTKTSNNMEKTIFERVEDYSNLIYENLLDVAQEEFSSEKANFESWHIACKIVELELYAKANIVDVSGVPSGLEYIGMQLRSLAEKE